MKKKDTAMVKRLLVRIAVPLCTVLLLALLSFYLLDVDNKIQEERQQSYSGGGNMATSYSLFFFMMNLPGIFVVIFMTYLLIFITWDMNIIIPDYVAIIISSVFYFCLGYFVIYSIQKRKRKKK